MVFTTQHDVCLNNYVSDYFRVDILHLSNYVCGITAYALSHIGHARATVSFKVLHRRFRRLGYQVTYVANFIDVDNNIINCAKKNGENPLEFSSCFCEEYRADMCPRVSEHMDEIIKMIENIIKKVCGYIVEGDVFFCIDKYVEKSPDYGKLSEHTRAGKRVAVDSRKRNPADFALWKSPWGRGRPGWHIECSAMSARHLSPKFDIHGGRADLIFPHHENELAQTCAAYEDGGVKYWLHNRHVTTIDKEKIYSESKLDSSSEALYYVYQTLQDLDDALMPYREAFSQDSKQTTAEAKYIINKLKREFDSKMSDDLNTVHILTGAYDRAMKFINSSIGKLEKMQKRQRMSLVVSLFGIEREAREVLDELGLLPTLSCAEILKEMKQKALTRAGLSEEVVSQKMEERTMARKKKEFGKSDQIREELKVKGIELIDVGNETVWKPFLPSQANSSD
ncbi:hypothetical protein Bca52824_010888 [Brassica carinata]|uniref:tRNA synthetases class I catalytic domain-containing protein n=1 Tax=Brassica carinata TaxID=52824 RepID=A0A8X7WF90_BRACI|nr:hypothetical protein Bca52824_010888 [Brassica carinata]